MDLERLGVTDLERLAEPERDRRAEKDLDLLPLLRLRERPYLLPLDRERECERDRDLATLQVDPLWNRGLADLDDLEVSIISRPLHLVVLLDF